MALPPKTASRVLTLSCGHERRIRIEVPSVYRSHYGSHPESFEEWRDRVFGERVVEPCPSCRAIPEAERVDQWEAQFAGWAPLPRFEEESLATATYARSLRMQYLEHARQGVRHDDPTTVVVLIRAALQAALGGQATRERADLLTDRVLWTRAAGRLSARYWIINKAKIASFAEQDATSREILLGAYAFAAGEWPDLDAAFAGLWESLTTQGTADARFLNDAVAAGTALPEVMEQMLFLRALRPAPDPGPPPF